MPTLVANRAKMQTHRPAKGALIELRNVVKNFKSAAGTFAALKGVSLEINRGEFVANHCAGSG